jgi:hypothetical protein
MWGGKKIGVYSPLERPNKNLLDGVIGKIY